MCGAHILQCFLIGNVKNENEQIRKLRLHLNGSWQKGYSQHLQYVDSLCNYQPHELDFSLLGKTVAPESPWSNLSG